MQMRMKVVLALVVSAAVLPALAQDRDLSTPLSRLVGQWKSLNGFDWYFYPLAPGEEGNCLRIWPDKKTLMDNQTKLIEKTFQAKPDAAEMEKQIREADAYFGPKAGTGEHYKYQVVENDAAGTRLFLRVFLSGKKPEEGERTVFYVEKDGLTMRKFLKPPVGPPTAEIPSTDENPLKFLGAALPPLPPKK